MSPLQRDTAVGRALQAVWSVLPQARLVGGVVRDLLAGETATDLDFGTPEPPETVLQRLGDAAIRAIATGLAHGTVTALVEGHGIEITTLRRDESTDGRHAVVAWTADWREDARRRDFTINAMSLSRDGRLFDYFGGRDDLQAKRVRFVGRAAARIAEDALRILRFFRFQARFGDAVPDPEAVAAIEAGAPLLDRLSAERVWSELRRILVGPRLAATLALMAQLGVLDRLLPGGAVPARPERVPPDPILRLAALLAGPPAPVARRLLLSNAEAERLAALLDGPAPEPTLDDAGLRRLLAEHPPDLLCGRSFLAQAARMPAEAPAWQALRDRLASTPRPVFPLAGRDLLALGLQPGPAIGQLLGRARAWWRAGGCVADRAACLAWLRGASTFLPPDGPAC